MTRYIITLLAIIAVLISTCKSKNIQKDNSANISDQYELPIQIKTDSMEWFSFNKVNNGYGKPVYKFVISQDSSGNYSNNESSGKWKKEIKYENSKMSSASFWSFGKESDIFIMKYNSEGELAEINRYKSFQLNEPIKLKSREKYDYKDGMLETYEFVDFLRIQSLVDSTAILMNHKYDNQKRLYQTIISMRSGNRSYSNVDTVSYFYEGNSFIPYKVNKTAFEGTEYTINQTDKMELEIEKVHKEIYKDSIAVIKTINFYKFDENGRVIEYRITTDVNMPNELKEVKYEKYLYEYSNELKLKTIPKLLFHQGQQNIIPHPDVLQYLTSKVEIAGYPDVPIRTNLNHFELPKLVERFKSTDGMNWQAESKYEIKE